jgi:hypothetical protein
LTTGFLAGENRFDAEVGTLSVEDDDEVDWEVVALLPWLTIELLDVYGGTVAGVVSHRQSLRVGCAVLVVDVTERYRGGCWKLLSLELKKKW